MHVATPPHATRPARLSRDQIVASAVEIAGRDGLEALSIRAIATALGVSPMALYRHVATKEEIVDLVVGEMLAQQSDRREWPAAWDDVLRLVAEALANVLRTDPAVLDTLQRRAMAGPHTLDGMEHLLAALAAVGVDDPAAATGIYGNVVGFVFGHVALQYGRSRAREAQGISADEQRGRLMEQVTQLSATDYPRVRAASADIPSLFEDHNARLGIERLIDAFRAEHSLP